MTLPDWPAFEALAVHGALHAIDLHLARALGRMVPEASHDVLVAAALASRAVQQGHVCVDLRAVAEEPWKDEDGVALVPALRMPPLQAWLGQLRESALVATEVNEAAPRPLVLDEQGRLYLYRYARYQKRLVDSLHARANIMEPVDVKLLRQGLARMFPHGEGEREQRQAAGVAVLRRFSVISGGPGTGKTFTVARILALLQEQSLLRTSRPLRVKAVAPTGKAAQRLVESMTAAVAELDCAPEVRDAVLVPASTIHRALGFLPQTPTRFRHGQDNPLAADVVVVDEASMVDLALMAKLSQAVSPMARLILLGDKDQLASVEAGSILADIYGDSQPGYSDPMAEQLEALGETVVRSHAAQGELRDGCIHLSRSRRYDEHSGIGALARAVNVGDAAAALSVVRGPGAGNVCLSAGVTTELVGKLQAQALSAFKGLRAADPASRLQLMSRFKILCAHRRGPAGAQVVNEQIEALLASEGIIEPEKLWYDGRPLLITANDPALELFNGDVGVVCEDRQTGVPLAHFPAPDGQGTRAIAPARLPPHDTVFAMTVHKSQGSEFHHVALLLPDRVSPVLTRELFYTAITRARSQVDIYGSPEILEAAISRSVQRASGLRAALWP